MASIIAAIIIGIVLLNISGFFNPQDNSTQVVLTSELPNSKTIEQILQEDVIGYGFVWLSNNESYKGILTNIHIENGKMVDTWHNELIATNYDNSDSFCINSLEPIGSVKVENDQITTILDSDELELSEDYFTVKIVNDLDCYYHIRAIITQN